MQDNHASTPPLKFFYRPDALFATQPTVSKHWRHLTTMPVTCLNRQIGDRQLTTHSLCSVIIEAVAKHSADVGHEKKNNIVGVYKALQAYIDHTHAKCQSRSKATVEKMETDRHDWLHYRHYLPLLMQSLTMYDSYLCVWFDRKKACKCWEISICSWKMEGTVVCWKE